MWGTYQEKRQEGTSFVSQCVKFQKDPDLNSTPPRPPRPVPLENEPAQCETDHPATKDGTSLPQSIKPTLYLIWWASNQPRFMKTLLPLSPLHRISLSASDSLFVWMDMTKTSKCKQEDKEAVSAYLTWFIEAHNRHCGIVKPVALAAGDAAPGAWKAHLRNSFINGLKPGIVRQIKQRCVLWETAKPDKDWAGERWGRGRGGCNNMFQLWHFIKNCPNVKTDAQTVDQGV